MYDSINTIDEAFLYSLRKCKIFADLKPSESFMDEIFLGNSKVKGARMFLNPTKLISQTYNKFKKELNLRHEIYSNIVTGNKGYFALLQHTFNIHYTTIVKYFGNDIVEYFTLSDPKSALTQLLKKDRLTVTEAVLAVKISLIYYFLLFEEMVESCYPEYTKLLIKEKFIDQPDKSNHIRLSYEGTVLNMIHDELTQKKLIDVSLIEFKQHFVPTSGVNRIKWYGTEVALIIMFTGHDDVSGLNILAHDPLSLIPTHFIKASGEEYKISQIRVAHQKHREKPRGIDPILNLLKKLNG